MVIFIGYRRYYPVKGIVCINSREVKDKDITVLDIRNYNETTDDSSIQVLNIPYAYLKRFYLEIPQDKIHIIAVDRVELNLGIRFLRKKGFIIQSYELATCPCKNKSKKGMLGYGI
ncbi:sulfurtransferase [Priestia aryabhattai]|uniref:sulfurtransferase n=1 Tax=Priestia aryabhattai TaxID=412384 RepID=UPI003981D3BB